MEDGFNAWLENFCFLYSEGFEGLMGNSEPVIDYDMGGDPLLENFIPIDWGDGRCSNKLLLLYHPSF